MSQGQTQDTSWPLQRLPGKEGVDRLKDTHSFEQGKGGSSPSPSARRITRLAPRLAPHHAQEPQHHTRLVEKRTRALYSERTLMQKQNIKTWFNDK